MEVVSICNLKGGTGKSTVTMLLASALGAAGDRVLVIDTDAQKTIQVLFDLEAGPDKKPLFDLEAISPKFVVDVLRLKADLYDIIFIDVPRSTESKTDTAVSQIIALCDTLLIPVLPSRLDVLSTLDFLPMIQEIDAFKQKNGLPFKYKAFLNKVKNRNETDFSKSALEGNGLPLMDALLSDLKLFLYPNAFESVLESKEGKERFEQFFNEAKNLIYG